MSWKNIKEYFLFTQKERIGIFTLMMLITVVFMLPIFFPPPQSENNKQEFEKFKNEIADIALKKKNADGHANQGSQHIDSAEKGDGDFEMKNKQAELFDFDPNKASVEEWKKLGLRDKTIKTIQHYLSKGGKFFKPEDVQKIYGFPGTKYQQLLPYIKIGNEHVKGKEESKKTFARYIPKILEPCDINEADTSGFKKLPGIGDKLANRIVNFRNKLGGFCSIEQIGETYNLPDSTFQKIKPFLKIGNNALHKININTADVSVLKAHPYIKWNIANAIVQYRLQHGNYQSVDDLKQIASIAPEILLKIYPYLKTNDR
ncbi:MAG: helix-hairpin-helix domain-containing protein [Bacteroidetes bacterium]|nr:helix-hairpin-helix domain-containing protein [Bacteroidota bacterium]